MNQVGRNGDLKTDGLYSAGKGTLCPDGRTAALMRGIKSELEHYRGQNISYERLAEVAGLSTSTMFDNCHQEQKQLDGLIRLLEQMSPQARHRLLDQACRTMPTLDHPRLAHDPTQVSWLKMLSEQRSGLTVIQGANAGVRTFLVTALGHASQFPVTGLDVNRPSWFVPVRGVHYLDFRSPPALSTLKLSTPSLILLNGVWGSVPAAELCRLTRRCHVIVADELQLRPENISQFGPPLHIIQLSLDKLERIRTAIQAIKIIHQGE